MSQPIENKVIIDDQAYYGGLNQPNLKFIKVNVDCWEKISDFLSLRDILAMSQKCLRLRQIGGHYFRENFHATTCYLSESSSGLHISIAGYPLEREDFLRFIDTVEIRDEFENLKHLRIVSSMGLLSSLTTLNLWRINLNKHRMPDLENVRANIETIELFKCSIDDNSVKEFLASCPKLKCLRLEWVNFKSTETQANLFQRTYPMLEHFEYTSSDEMMPQLISFLKRNPNMKGIRIELLDLLAIPLDTSTVQLDYLNINVVKRRMVNVDTNANELLNRLKTLHASGFYKKLRLSIQHSIDGFDYDFFIQEMISFNALEALYTLNFYANICDLTQLKELHLIFLPRDVNLEAMAMKLINLEKLCIGGTVDQLSSFIRYAQRLKFVIFDEYSGGCKGLDLFKFNRVRQASGIKCKVQIGIYEDQPLYLPTKWKANILHLDLVEITRAETIRKHFICFK